ncbi:MAG TPA: hypothetical protein VL334_20705 [Anaerolineae bacterium]|nr:hypothetical protein [Anaerolineae bacterium]
MFGKISQPKWWLLYLLLPVLVGLFVIESKASISDAGHRVVGVGIVLLVFGLIELWLRANDANLRAQQWRAQQWHETRRVVYTAQGQFVSSKKAGAQPASATPARIAEAVPVAQGLESKALAESAVLEPIGGLSSPTSKPVSSHPFGFAIRRS